MGLCGRFTKTYTCEQPVVARYDHVEVRRHSGCLFLARIGPTEAVRYLAAFGC
jgi:hypothetical protein